MVMTKKGGQTLKKTLLEKHGSEEALREYFRQIGRKGGAASTTGGFAAATPEQVREWGAKGGKISRRNKNVKE